MPEEEINKKTEEEIAEKKPVDTSKQETETKEKIEDKKDQSKEKPNKKPVKIVKKDYAIVNSRSLPISTKKAVAICRFLKFKTIENAMNDLEKVLAGKKVVEIKGEIAHKKGPGKRGSGSGIYPKKASIYFIKVLKSLKANANINGLENPIIIEAVANKAMSPYGRFGRVKRKRTHVTLRVENKKTKQEKIKK